MFGKLKVLSLVALGATLPASGALAATCASLGSGNDYSTFTSCTADGNDFFATVSGIVDTLFDGSIVLSALGSFSSGPGTGAEFSTPSDINPGRDGFLVEEDDLNNTSFTFLSLPTDTLFVSLKQQSGFELFGLFGKTTPFTLTHSLGGTNTSHISTFAGPSQVPLPAAGWMLFAGLGSLVAMRRRKKKS